VVDGILGERLYGSVDGARVDVLGVMLLGSDVGFAGNRCSSR
jgi:hypothetical protein